MTDSYICFSTYHVALAHGLPYRQVFMYIQRYSQSIEENFEKEHMFRNLKTWRKHLKNTCGGVNLIMFQVFSPYIFYDQKTFLQNEYILEKDLYFIWNTKLFCVIIYFWNEIYIFYIFIYIFLCKKKLFLTKKFSL